MARSRYIYFVEWSWPWNEDPPHLIAAFTVKHELLSWWALHSNAELGVYRVRDGAPPGDTNRYDITREIKELIEEEAQ